MFTPWQSNIAIENGPSRVDLPIRDGFSYVTLTFGIFLGGKPRRYWVIKSVMFDDVW